MTLFWNKAFWLWLEKSWDAHKIALTWLTLVSSGTFELKVLPPVDKGRSSGCSLGSFIGLLENCISESEWSEKGLWDHSSQLTINTMISREGKPEIASRWTAKMELKPRTLDSQPRFGEQPLVQVSWALCGTFRAWAWVHGMEHDYQGKECRLLSFRLVVFKHCWPLLAVKILFFIMIQYTHAHTYTLPKISFTKQYLTLYYL